MIHTYQRASQNGSWPAYSILESAVGVGVWTRIARLESGVDSLEDHWKGLLPFPRHQIEQMEVSDIEYVVVMQK